MQEKKKKKKRKKDATLEVVLIMKKKNDIFQISLNTNVRTIYKRKFTKQNLNIFYKILNIFVNIYDNKYNQ